MRFYVGVTDNQWFDVVSHILEQPFFFEQSAWLPVPPDWKPSIQQGKHYDVEEHTLPALEAAHIKPFEENGPNAVYNGLLLRSDVHRLFDRGYMTVTPELRIEVSRRIREEFENGRYYYPFHWNKISHLPRNQADWPSSDLPASSRRTPGPSISLCSLGDRIRADTYPLGLGRGACKR
jgi:hypothetical protein